MANIKEFFKRFWWAAIIFAVLIAISITVLLGSLGVIELPGGLGGSKDDKPAVEPIPAYAWDHIIEHNQPNDCWIVLDTSIYDISNWEYGGEEDITPACGKLDATDYFASGEIEPPEDNLVGIWLRYGLM